MSVASPSARRAPRALRHRRSARRLSEDQVGDLRRAITAAQAIGDDRGYLYWAGIHGLPLPYFCTHDSPLFLPWHRAYLYFFEKALQALVPGVTLPWWDWRDHSEPLLPEIYAQRDVEGRRNPLYASPLPAAVREQTGERQTTRSLGDTRWLPDPEQVEAVRTNRDYFTFQTQLESLHNGVHGFVGGSMGGIATSAYDPIFWAHHCMIDRIWYLWQLDHPGAQLPAAYLDTALPPFEMTVRDTLDVTALGYDYAAATAAVPGTRRG